MIILFALNLLIPPAYASWWSNFCERYLISDDPDQYSDLTVEQLVSTYWYFYNADNHYSKTLMKEMRWRLRDDLGHEDREVLTKTLNHAEWRAKSLLERKP